MTKPARQGRDPKLERELEAERRETRKADLRWVMENPRGRRLMRELLYHPDSGLGLDTVPATANGSLLAAETGRRQVAKLWDNRIQAEFPEAWLTMHQEHLEDREEAKHLRETAAEQTREEEDESP